MVSMRCNFWHKMGIAYIRRLVEADASVLGGDLFNVLLVEIEAVDVEVLGEDLGAARLGDDGQAALRGPAEQDLRGLLAVLLGDARDDVVLEQRDQRLGVLEAELEEAGRAEGAVRRHGDALLLGQVEQLLLHQVRVVLDLQRGRRDARVPQHVVDELGLEVGDADAAGQAGVDEALDGPPGVLDGGLGPDDLRLAVVVPTGRVPRRRVDVLERAREVDQVQVKVVDAPVGQLPPHHGLDLLRVVERRPQLGHDEELLALHEPFLERAGHALAALLLVAVVCPMLVKRNCSLGVDFKGV